MDEFIEITKQLKEQGNSWAVFVKKEAESLGLRLGDDISLVLTSPRRREYVHSLLYGSDPYMFFVSAAGGRRSRYVMHKALSEDVLYQSMEKEPDAIIGPFLTLERCLEFQCMAEKELPEGSEAELKAMYNRFMLGE